MKIENSIREIICFGSALEHVDSARLVFGRLGNDHVEDAVCKASRHTILVNTSGKVESARKLSDASLGESIFGGVGRLLLGGVGLDHLAFGRGGGVSSLVFVLDSSLVRRLGALVLARLSDGAALGRVFKGASRRGASRVGALDFAADDNRLRVGKLDVHILLLHSRELAMEFVSFARLADIKLGLPVSDSAAAGTLVVVALAGVVVEVLKKAEEGSERGLGSVKVALKKGHFG